MIIMASRQLVQVGYTILGLLCVLCSQVFIKALHLYYDYGFFIKAIIPQSNRNKFELKVETSAC